MRQKNDLKLNDSHKKRIIQWEIPHLISVLKNEYAISAMHLISPGVFSLTHKQDWLVFDGKTGFPLFVGEHSFGILICFNVLNYPQAKKIRNYINIYFEKLFLKFVSNEYFVPSSLSVLDKLSLPDFALSSEKNCYFLFDKEEKVEKVLFSVKKKTGHSFFPLLLKQGRKEDLLKQAHELYLKTSSFAFLNTEDLNWKEGVFQEMSGVFVCVPFFHQLSDFQKKVLNQDLLHKKLSCHLVMGIQKEEELPEEWKNLFRCVL